jgi:hypothetical protein
VTRRSIFFFFEVACVALVFCFFGAAIGIARVLTSAIIELYLFVPFVLPSKGGVRRGVRPNCRRKGFEKGKMRTPLSGNQKLAHIKTFALKLLAE